jgi:DNA-binding response OmpR family regulator
MKSGYGRFGFIGGGSGERAAFESWCRSHSFDPLCLALEEPVEAAELRKLDAIVIATAECPLLALAECARVRGLLPDLPVALLGRQGGELEAAAARAGAVFLPSAPAERGFRALLDQLAARRSAALGANRVWVSERLCLDRTRRVLYLDGQERTLSAAKFDLFSYLFDNAGRAVSARELVQRGLLLPSQASRYKGLIAELRAHLGGERACIRAVPGYGYRLELREGPRAARAQKLPLNANVEPDNPTARPPFFP